ncbi:hypothetical protein FPQ18DRAFT_387658 [Pyronema domesticum]|nr:hypothetical protein FPQ18DRAFT_387658 [Pyronema domesticum]
MTRIISKKLDWNWTRTACSTATTTTQLSSPEEEAKAEDLVMKKEADFTIFSEFETNDGVYPDFYLTLASLALSALAVMSIAKRKIKKTLRTIRRMRNIYTKLINLLGVVSFGFGFSSFRYSFYQARHTSSTFVSFQGHQANTTLVNDEHDA